MQKNIPKCVPKCITAMQVVPLRLCSVVSNIEGGLARIENGIGAAVLENLPDQIKRSGNLAGQAATDRWTEQIKDTASSVDQFSYKGLEQSDGKPVKDLNDLFKISTYSL
jgi:hypothetical protein